MSTNKKNDKRLKDKINYRNVSVFLGQTIIKTFSAKLLSDPSLLLQILCCHY